MRHERCARVQTGDDQVVAQFALNAFAASTDVGDRLLTQAWDQKSRAHARTLCRLWAAKGYQVVYLSGRQVRMLPQCLPPQLQAALVLCLLSNTRLCPYIAMAVQYCMYFAVSATAQY